MFPGPPPLHPGPAAACGRHTHIPVPWFFRKIHQMPVCFLFLPIIKAGRILTGFPSHPARMLFLLFSVFLPNTPLLPGAYSHEFPDLFSSLSRDHFHSILHSIQHFFSAFFSEASTQKLFSTVITQLQSGFFFAISSEIFFFIVPRMASLYSRGTTRSKITFRCF